MKLSPHSRATWTLESASSRFTERNSWPSELAPKPRIGSWRPVWPRGRVCMGSGSEREEGSSASRVKSGLLVST